MLRGSCLCGAHRFEAHEPFELMHHCHCGFCRKTHGAAFVTMVGVPASSFRWGKGAPITAYASSPGMTRDSCATCGTPLPVRPPDSEQVFVPAGCLEGDPGVRPIAHIFAASRAPWFEIQDDLPAFDEYPPGFTETVYETRPPLDPPGGLRGSCLCGTVRYVIDAEPITARHCHCGRCRRARAAAHASNLIVPADAIRFTSGEDALRAYRVPDAEFFTHTFCGPCGSSAPGVDRRRGFAVVPMGGLDDAPPIGPREHIFVGSKAPWYEIPDALPQHDERPPPR